MKVVGCSPSAPDQAGRSDWLLLEARELASRWESEVLALFQQNWQVSLTWHRGALNTKDTAGDISLSADVRLRRRQRTKTSCHTRASPGRTKLFFRDIFERSQPRR